MSDLHVLTFSLLFKADVLPLLAAGVLKFFIFVGMVREWVGLSAVRAVVGRFTSHLLPQLFLGLFLHSMEVISE